MNLHYISEHYKGYEITIEQNGKDEAYICLYKDEVLVFDKELVRTLSEVWYWHRFYMSYIDNNENTSKT